MFALERNHSPDGDDEDRAWFTVATAATYPELVAASATVDFLAGRYRVTRTEEAARVDRRAGRRTQHTITHTKKRPHDR